ncbi:MAG: 16S rRNA (cytosine(1402)-N(4))-methyltransferase RsmH [Candidatus Paceibacterota bacterium]|jgi:16S rRNA (cytosine1402-N4)-methyltransferase
MAHISVLQKEVIEYLDPKPNQNFIDCTADGGGHTAGILEKTAPKGKVLAIDWDQEMTSRLKEKSKEAGWKGRVIVANDNFANLKEIIKRKNFKKINGILFDLGFSSFHPDESRRGFTFQKQEPLDMRYDANNPLTVEKILNFSSEQDLEKILAEYGEEKFAREIAREIIMERRSREIKNTFQLVSIVKRAVPEKFQHQKIHPATRTFQALRIAVNDELNNIKKGLAAALEAANSGGRVVAISFHSLEDRIVKNFIKENKNNIQGLTKKPIGPKWDEIRINPRSRSAKLRAFQKI